MYIVLSLIFFSNTCVSFNINICCLLNEKKILIDSFIEKKANRKLFVKTISMKRFSNYVYSKTLPGNKTFLILFFERRCFR